MSLEASTKPAPLDASVPAAVDGLAAAVARRGSLVQTMKAVAWSFFGVRKSADHQRDVEQLNPVHLVVAGVVSAALFVAALVMLVNWVTVSGIAA